MPTTSKKAAASKAPARRAKKAAKATPVKAARTTAKKTPAKKTAKKTAKKALPVTFNNLPAKNRHFLLDEALYEEAQARCREQGYALSDVLRYGIEQYGKRAPKQVPESSTANALPKSALATLKSVWKTGNTAYVNAYLSALHQSGWTTRVIAEGLVATGVVERMSRQAVSLRITQARADDFSFDLPRVPLLGPRRTIVSSKRIAKAREGRHDFSFRVADEDYEAAANRAKSEGAMMSSVLDGVLIAYIRGDFDKALAKIS